jgi:hypothetical protein
MKKNLLFQLSYNTSLLSVILFCFFIISVAGCGGGSGSNNGGTAPILSSLTFSPTSAVVGAGDGNTVVSYSFTFSDVEANISTGTFRVFDSDNNLLYSNTDSIDGISGMSSGVMTGGFYADTSVSGKFRFKIYLTDETNLKSNALEGEFAVTLGSAPTISNLSNSFESGKTLKLSTGIWASDVDDNILNMTVTVYDSNHVQVWKETTDIRKKTIVQEEYHFTPPYAGQYTLEVYATDYANLNSNVLTSDMFTVSIDGGVATVLNYTPSGMGDTVIGDVNGDGRNDVVLLDKNDMQILIYFQNTLGGLDSPVSIALNIYPSGIGIGDVNNDGKADIIVAGKLTVENEDYSGRIEIMLQNPISGELESPQDCIVESNNLMNLEIADLNGDNLNDIVVLREEGPAIFFQDSDGKLMPEVDVNIAAYFYGSYEGEIHVSDMDNDGKKDLVLQSGAKELAVVKQTEPGVFSSAPERYAVQTSYWGCFTTFALGDLNGDGLTDIVTVDPGNTGYINIFLQNSQGTLENAVLIDQPFESFFGVEVAEITGDGLNDIVMDNYNGIIVLPQTSDHTFSGSNLRYYYNHAGSSGGSLIDQALSIGDVTGDGVLDAVAPWDELYVFPGIENEIRAQ